MADANRIIKARLAKEPVEEKWARWRIEHKEVPEPRPLPKIPKADWLTDEEIEQLVDQLFESMERSPLSCQPSALSPSEPAPDSHAPVRAKESSPMPCRQSPVTPKAPSYTGPTVSDLTPADPITQHPTPDTQYSGPSVDSRFTIHDSPEPIHLPFTDSREPAFTDELRRFKGNG